MLVDSLKASAITPIIKENTARETRVFAEEAGEHFDLWRTFAEHDFVRTALANKAGAGSTRNMIEGYFSVVERGMKGVYPHCAKKRLHRYLAEFDFRYNEREANGVNDRQRTDNALKGILGKRLTHRDSSWARISR